MYQFNQNTILNFSETNVKGLCFNYPRFFREMRNHGHVFMYQACMAALQNPLNCYDENCDHSPCDSWDNFHERYINMLFERMIAEDSNEYQDFLEKWSQPRSFEQLFVESLKINQLEQLKTIERITGDFQSALDILIENCLFGNMDAFRDVVDNMEEDDNNQNV
jgi:hypothetical protein